MQAWAKHLADVREEERRRIARELHDELGQLLAALKLELVGLSSVAPQPAAAQRIESMRSLIDHTVVAVRRISHDLRPLELDDLGLNAALEGLGRSAAERMGIEVTVRHGESDLDLPPDLATMLYRMVQEALTNAGRHARATDVAVELECAHGEILLTVEDNGIGLPGDALQREGHWGLRGMAERAALCGGVLLLDNAPGSGARLTVRVPLRSTAEAD